MSNFKYFNFEYALEYEDYIKTRFRELVKIYHPDKNNGNDKIFKEILSERDLIIEEVRKVHLKWKNVKEWNDIFFEYSLIPHNANWKCASNIVNFTNLKYHTNFEAKDFLNGEITKKHFTTNGWIEYQLDIIPFINNCELEIIKKMGEILKDERMDEDSKIELWRFIEDIAQKESYFILGGYLSELQCELLLMSRYDKNGVFSILEIIGRAKDKNKSKDTNNQIHDYENKETVASEDIEKDNNEKYDYLGLIIFIISMIYFIFCMAN